MYAQKKSTEYKYKSIEANLPCVTHFLRPQKNVTGRMTHSEGIVCVIHLQQIGWFCIIIIILLFDFSCNVSFFLFMFECILVHTLQAKKLKKAKSKKAAQFVCMPPSGQQRKLNLEVMQEWWRWRIVLLLLLLLLSNGDAVTPTIDVRCWPMITGNRPCTALVLLLGRPAADACGGGSGRWWRWGCCCGCY